MTASRPFDRAIPAALTFVLVSCARMPAPQEPGPTTAVGQPATRALADRTMVRIAEPALPPRLAMFAGLMPLRSIGADRFRSTHPAADGRGVILAILDSGVDAGLPGLRRTTTGERKILDLRDFSGEGRVLLRRVSDATEGAATIAGRSVRGFGRITGLAAGPYYGGVFEEITLGSLPSGDLNGDGDLDDVYVVVVARASDGWIALIDANGNGSLADERPLRDFAVAQETVAFRGEDGRAGPLTVVVNLDEVSGAPQLDLVMDNSSHGSHVAGIAAGNDMFGVEGFEGVAPGAQVLALKIANNTRGGISVSGSMMKALAYAAGVAQGRGQPLVVNLSYGVGNTVEGATVIDSLINAFALQHPDVLVVISAGNDGPGISTMGSPGSASLPLSVCALFPGVFAAPPRAGRPPAADVLGWWSARGGEVAKPDACAPGVAYSNVPPWRMGEEVSGGTSMAAPQVAGAAALLQSGLRPLGITARAIDLKRALVNTARPLAGTSILDEGLGVIDVPAAFQWLRAGHQTGVYEIVALPNGGNTSRGSAAYRRGGLVAPDDTVQAFRVTSIGGQPAARLLLESDVPWLRSPSVLEPGGAPVTVDLTYDATTLREPGVYVGTVWARPATDPLAGASFGLTNTVIVPHPLDVPLVRSGMLTPGAAARYFLDVPSGSAGLQVRIDLGTSGGEATMYLFEPDGRPHRGGSSVVASTGVPSVELMVAAEDVVPGVYEAVVVAPPSTSVSFRLTASVSAARVHRAPGEAAIAIQNPLRTTLTVAPSAFAVGFRSEHRVSAANGRPGFVRVVVPDSTASLALEASMEGDLWRRLTDFGVTVFDRGGQKLSDGPLHYPLGRQTLALESSASGDTLVIELLPAFAKPEDAGDWEARLRVDFFSQHPLSLVTPGPAGNRLSLSPGADVRLAFAVPADSTTRPVPAGTLVEMYLELGDGTRVRSLDAIQR